MVRRRGPVSCARCGRLPSTRVSTAWCRLDVMTEKFHIHERCLFRTLSLLDFTTVTGNILKGGASPRVNSAKAMFSCDPCRSSASWTLGPPPTRRHAHAPCACRRLLGFAWIERVRAGEVHQCRGFWKQGASAWRRTIIVEVSHFAPPVTGAITAASRTTETASATHTACIRRVLAKRHALRCQPTINRGPALPGEFATSRPLPVLSTL